MTVIIEIVEEDNSIKVIKKINGEYTSMEDAVAGMVIAITKNQLQTILLKHTN